MRPTVNPVEDDRSDEGSGVEEESEITEGLEDEDDFVKESHNDYEAVANIQDVFKQTHGFFEKKFCTAERNIKWKLNLADDASKRLKFLIDTDLNDTWLGTPKSSKNDSIGTWSAKKLVFSAKNKWVPDQFTNQQPVRIPFKFNDSNDAEYFEQKTLMSNGKKIDLPTSIFSPNSAVNTDSCIHLFEYWGREGLLDSEITHNILELNKDMVGSNLNVLKSIDLTDVDDAKEKLDVLRANMQNIFNFNALAVQSNYRSKTFHILTNVKAKHELRSQILKRYEGDASLIEKLQGSHFYTNTLFGPIAEELYNKPGCSNRRAPLQAKRFQPIKRQVNQSGPKVKKPRVDNYFNYGRNFNSGATNSFNDTKPKTYDNYWYEPRYSSQPLFPRDQKQRGSGQRRGKRGSKR